jgi:hypothetical protein
MLRGILLSSCALVWVAAQVPMGQMLLDFIEVLAPVPTNTREASVIGTSVSKCLTRHLSQDIPANLATWVDNTPLASFSAGRPPVGGTTAYPAPETVLPSTPEVAFVASMWERHPPLQVFTQCLLTRRAVPQQVLHSYGGCMLFQAITHFGLYPPSSKKGAQPSIFSLIDALINAAGNATATRAISALDAGGPHSTVFGCSLGGVLNGYNILHRILDRHKTFLQLVTSNIVRSGGKPNVRYFAFLKHVAASIGPELPPRQAAMLIRAVDRLCDPVVYGQDGEEVGLRVWKADADIVSEAVVVSLVNHIVPRMLPPIASNQAVRQIAQQANGEGEEDENNNDEENDADSGIFVHLMEGRDKFCRSPLHIATGEAPSALPVLMDVLQRAGALQSASVVAALTSALSHKDCVGHIPLQLGLNANNTAAVEYLRHMQEQLGMNPAITEAESTTSKPAGRRPYEIRRHRKLQSRVRPTHDDDAQEATAADGGWSMPLYMSESAVQTIAAAANATSSGRCDLDVLDASLLPHSDLQSRFIYDYVIPAKPVILRGFHKKTDNLFQTWSVSTILKHHGGMPFEVATIPYVC